jgi:hypothetical protein
MAHSYVFTLTSGGTTLPKHHFVARLKIRSKEWETLINRGLGRQISRPTLPNARPAPAVEFDPSTSHLSISGTESHDANQMIVYRKNFTK